MASKMRLVVLVGGLLGDVPPNLEPLDTFADIVIVDNAISLAAELPKAEILFIWNYRYAELSSLLGQAPHLKWIHVAAVGVDPILSPELLKSNILLTNSRGVFDAAIAEYVAGLLIAHAKDLRGTFEAQRQAKWSYRLTRRIAGQEAVVVGTGSIGRTIARTLEKLDIHVQLVGRRIDHDDVFGEIRPSSELDVLVKGVDYLVLAVPLTNETRGMVNTSVLNALGPDGYLVNVGRGPLVVEDDLIKALSKGEIAGAALDVFDIEPLPPESILWSLPNVVVSPHMSGDYFGFEEDLVKLFASNLHRWISGEPLENVIDQSRGYVVGT